MKEYRKTHPRDKTKIEIAQLRTKEEVFRHYGNGTIACVRCGFNDIRALSIDHLSENGAEERRILKKNGNSGGASFYGLLKKQGYPSGYQTMCYNCNIIKFREYQAARKIVIAQTGGPNV
jgi:hypothetical protein